MTTVFCIDCEQPIKLEHQLVESETITCPSCGAELEVIGVDPVELDWVYLKPIGCDEDWCWWKKEKM